MEILKFGRFKGQRFNETPMWYQDWLLKQDWFNSQQKANDGFALVENGIIHTEDLALEDANEMQRRHKNCFPTHIWEVLPMSAVVGMDKGEGILERHRRISTKYA
jgi:hypothetical protein